MSDEREQPSERLQKVLARAGVASRRAAEEMIQQGRVRVDGRVVTELGTRVSESQEILVDGRLIRRNAQPIYLALNKPPGYVSTASDPQGRPTVIDLARRAGWGGQRVYPVGRLDLTSEGLILLTNDGDLALRLTHPRYGEEREYLVRLQERPTEADLDRLRQGGLLVEGRPTAPAQVSRAEPPAGMQDSKDGCWLRFVLHEGRKRQIRLMCEAIGHPVERLIRVRMGPIRLGSLSLGAVRPLTPAEVRALQQATEQNTGDQA